MKRIVLFICCLLMVGTSMDAQEVTGKLEVAGKAKIKEMPKEIEFRIPLKILDSSYVLCNQRLLETLKHLQNDLTKKGVEEKWINTVNFSISENMVFKNGQRQQDGFKGVVNVVVHGNYSEGLVRIVLESIRSSKLSYSINFSMSEGQKAKLNELALKNAVEDAKEKALILSKASGVQLGKISKISYGLETFRSEPFMKERVMSVQENSSSNELSLSPPLVSVSKSVLIVWEID